MSKKLLVSVIAIILVAAITGTCFALYSVDASNKVVSISAGYQVVNMQIKNGTNSAVLSDVDFDDAFDPTTNSQYVDVVLAITNASLADGVHGLFTAAVSGDLAAQVDVTVNLLTAVGGSVSTDITAAATGSGYDIALSATPVAVRITIALKAAAIADFSLAAEKTGTLTLGWAKVAGSVFTYDADAYYLVGTVNGVTAWYPCATSVLLDGELTDSNHAQKLSVALSAGDEFKVVKNYEAGDGFWTWCGAGDNFDTANYEASAGGNISIKANGNYNIYVNGFDVIYISVAE